MLDPSAQLTTVPPAADQPRIVFRMIGSDRMAGSVPAWVSVTGARDQAVAALSAPKTTPKFSDDLTKAMAYGPQQTPAAPTDDDKPFGFGDVLDIVNPLQHIPLVSTLYRTITGDHIRPSAEIIGGAIYGGLPGAASGLANLIMKKETGKTLMEHAVALVEGPSETTPPTRMADNAGKSVERLAQAEASQLKSLPGTALSFVDLGNRAGQPLQAPPSRWGNTYKFNT